ncbi:MAG: hypothetical protein HC849_28640 [Oscillatoriales cyanobacterium RU_3_3]|nr:hypothetical protein [Microcoleus sp. SU_5_6]NJL68228.1 hypothetical protein [Microcoleus sp. SM1_3_4]NJM63248.1 hypothetical protein [Oscillatoriales cyanobacterium RU_3_3]NJR21583.1 hypothetical protein [Richelia sp. CSU_2_1]
MTIEPGNKTLKSNPFVTYRDPLTGKWIVVLHQNLQKSQAGVQPIAA